MRIVQVHNFYQQAGGEDVVVENEKRLLDDAGHEVVQYMVHNDSIKNTRKKIITAINTAYSPTERERFMRFISENEPEVVHVHNFFPILTPSIFDACLDMRVGSVLTLHNYRIICPGGLLMRDAHVCEECLAGSAFRSVAYGCYRGSMLATLPVAHMVVANRRRGTWRNRVGAFIALTEFAKNKFSSGGIPENKIQVKPNFVPDPLSGLGANFSGNRKGALFVGRLSPEKGIKTMLEAWQGLEVPLRIAGDGPLSESVRRAASKNIMYLGRLSGKEVSEQMKMAAFLVMPSEWYEGFPMVLAEAFAHGLPVIGSNIGAIREVVRNEVSGLHFKAGDPISLRAAVQRIHDLPDLQEELSINARNQYVEAYSPHVNLEKLIEIYSKVQAGFSRQE